MENTIEMLQELLSQDQFELILPEKKGEDTIRLVYLMNDAAESFLVFRQARMTGTYQSEYEGALEATLSQNHGEYVLSVWQGESVVTLFFEKLELEVHLYNYGETGHFWVSGWEYLRRLEYLAAILRDKWEYLGRDFCTETEQKLAQLADFPPLNFCSYPSVPEKYLVRRKEGEIPSEEALDVMEELAMEVGDDGMRKMLRLYRKHPRSVLLRKTIAGMVRHMAHAAVVDRIAELMYQEGKRYPNRSFGTETDTWLRNLLEREKSHLASFYCGTRPVLAREEPFAAAEDGMKLQVYRILFQKSRLGFRTSEIQKAGELMNTERAAAHFEWKEH